MNPENKIEIFQAPNGAIEFKGDLKNETIWANQKQIAKLFGTKIPAINKHIKNILESKELDNSTISILEIVQKEGKRDVKRAVEFYNLDMIIAIGYRVNSKLATQFRKWSATILKKYLFDGYVINQKRLSAQKQLLQNLKQTIFMLSQKEIEDQKEVLNLLAKYTKTLSLLEQYDKNDIDDMGGYQSDFILTYKECKSLLETLRDKLIAKNEATALFANEKAGELKGIIGNLYQTFDGVELYPSIEDRASNLLYFIVKDHPFSDGNKRSASFLFIYFLDKCDYLYKVNGEIKINDNALTTLVLLVANSNPKEKELMVKLIKHLIFEKNLTEDKK